MDRALSWAHLLFSPAEILKLQSGLFSYHMWVRIGHPSGRLAFGCMSLLLHKVLGIMMCRVLKTRINSL